MILLTIYFLSPLASYIPLTVLAAVLLVVAWNMVERTAIKQLFRAGVGEIIVFMVTLGLTLFHDLAEAILVGFLLGSVLFIHRLAQQLEFSPHSDENTLPEVSQGIFIYRVQGLFFFGGAAAFSKLLERLSVQPQVLILDLSSQYFVDITAAKWLEGLGEKQYKQKKHFILVVPNRGMRRSLLKYGLDKHSAIMVSTLASALTKAKSIINNQ